MSAPSPQIQLEGFLDRFSPEIAAVARAALVKMRAKLPGAIELVYDNYNALAVGWGPDEKASHAIFSIAVFPRSVALCFTHGVGLPDPAGRLRGGGNQVRNVRLERAETLDEPAVIALIAEAQARAIVPLDPAQPYRLVIKSISAKQRPRRPA